MHNGKRKRKTLSLSCCNSSHVQAFIKLRRGFAHLITKNPMHSDWLVTVFHDHEYSLAELHDGCGDLDKRSYDNPVELADYERNVSLFRALRYHAYAVVHHFDSHKTFHAHLEC
ncbi:replication initiation protein, partial [Vibrio parahaemolyticus]|nr:replication initiation protein [Vibrio parahaemolyticus]MCF9925083.1 replication initiation protein [Vibrio parahaemolyticus]